MKKVVFTTALLVGLLAFLLPAQATIITFDLNYEFSGGEPPGGGAPWLSASFDDGGTAGSVTLTMTAAGLTDAEHVKAWFFNLDPSFDPFLKLFELTITENLISSEQSANLILYGPNYTNIAGGGWFDIGFLFPDSNSQDRFEVGDVSVWDFTLTGAMAEFFDADSFNFFSTPSGGNGTYLTAAHVGGIGDTDGSGWIGPSDSVSVPEPSTMLLLGVGLIGLAGIGRKKFVKK